MTEASPPVEKDSSASGKAAGPAPASETVDIGPIHQAAQRLAENVGRVIVGQAEAVRLVLVALLTGGHILLEDVPGVGKTTLAKTVAASLDMSFKRIQFTPDLLPSDVTGLNYYNQAEGRFRFLPGPIMANLVLADEINRATPRTQASLLEAMQELQVTIDAEAKPLPRPFLVMATQNPVEQEGTFPLPEAQLDRFLLRISQGYPTAEEEAEIIQRFERTDPLAGLGPVAGPAEILDLQQLVRRVYVEPSVRDYLVSLVRATRGHGSIRLGASPRAAQGLYAAAQALAAIQGRNYVLPDDVKQLAGPVLGHRLLLSAEARLKGGGRNSLVGQIVESLVAPVD